MMRMTMMMMGSPEVTWAAASGADKGGSLSRWSVCLPRTAPAGVTLQTFDSTTRMGRKKIQTKVS